MRLELNIEAIHGAGAEVIAVSVNDDERQAGMAERWNLEHIRMVSDPGGADILVPLGAFDPDERDGIALPAVIVVGPDGSEVYRYNGRDFADRTTDEEAMAALVALDLDPVEPGPWAPNVAVSDDLKGFFPTASYGAYFRGNRSAAIAIGGRLPNKETAAFARQHREMADTSLEAWRLLNG